MCDPKIIVFCDPESPRASNKEIGLNSNMGIESILMDLQIYKNVCNTFRQYGDILDNIPSWDVSTVLICSDVIGPGEYTK